MKLSEYIEHTLLKVDCTEEQIELLLNEAKMHQFYGVCIPPYYVSYAKSLLTTNKIRLISVVGFPLGYQHNQVKCEAIKILAQQKVDEVDVVTNISAIKNKAWLYIQEEWEAIIKTARKEKLPIKIIIESGLLNESELTQLADLANRVQPDFIKTSTGFNRVGAELDKVIFLRKHLKPAIQIKASGGIKNAQQAKAFIEAGASRIGTSSGVQIVG